MVTSMHIDPNKMVTIKIDGIPVTVPSGIHHYGSRPGKSASKFLPSGHQSRPGCPRILPRLPVEDSHSRRLKTACNNLVDEAGDITTNSPKVRKARKTILELILANHPQDCLHCEKNGKCELQTLAAEYNIRGNIFDPVWKPVPKEMSNPALVRDMVKCVRCGRCVEACQAVQTTNAIGYSGRSTDFKITTAFEKPLDESPCVYWRPVRSGLSGSAHCMRRTTPSAFGTPSTTRINLSSCRPLLLSASPSARNLAWRAARLQPARW